MGSWRAPCGCAAGNSMYGDHPIMYVWPCPKHTETPEVQALLRQLRAKLLEVTKQ